MKISIVLSIVNLMAFSYINIKTKIPYTQFELDVDSFRQINQLEEEICSKFKKIHQYINKVVSLKRKEKCWRHRHALSGSIDEGAFSARLFIPDSDFPDGIHRGYEIDIEMTEIIFPKSYKHCVENVVGKAGFAKIFVRNGCQCRKCIKLYRWDSDMMDISSSNGYIQHQKLKNISLAKLSYSTQKDYIPHIKLGIAFLLERPIHEISISNRIEKITKATNAISINLNIGDLLIAKLSVDMSYNIKLLWKPTVIAQWEKQNRSWPPLNDLQEELQYGYIIAKPSFAEKDNPNTTELRYSFAHLERKIVSLQSSTQRLVYLIFKSMFYRWIIPIDPDRITSYIAKTIMLWTCEKYPPGDPFWTDNPQQILFVVHDLFRRLLEACRQQYLAYYFVPGINVLENVPRYATVRMRKTVTLILSQTSASIPKKLGTVHEILQNGKDVLHKIMDALYEFDEFGVNILAVWRPDILIFYGNAFYKEVQQFHNLGKGLYK